MAAAFVAGTLPGASAELGAGAAEPVVGVLFAGAIVPDAGPAASFSTAASFDADFESLLALASARATFVAGDESDCARDRRMPPERSRRITVPHEADLLRRFIGPSCSIRRLGAALDCCASRLEKLSLQFPSLQFIKAALRMKKNPFQLQCLLFAREVLLPGRSRSQSSHPLQRSLELLLQNETLHLKEILGISMRHHVFSLGESNVTDRHMKMA
jgi:hypothetical protein